MDLKLKTIAVVIYACFALHNICEKNNSHIDKELVKSQIESIKQDEKTYHNIPDPVFSYDGGEGIIREFVWKKKDEKDKNIQQTQQR